MRIANSGWSVSHLIVSLLPLLLVGCSDDDGDTPDADPVIVKMTVMPDGTDADAGSWVGGISADGRFVAFISGAQLLAADTNGVRDAYVFDRVTRTLELVSASSAGSPADGDTWDARISADGRHVVISSQATNLDPAFTVSAGGYQIFRRDRLLGVTVLVSVNPTGTGPAAQDCYLPQISSDGRYVVFDTKADLAGGSTSFTNVYRRDMTLGSDFYVLVSRADGHSGDPGNGGSRSAAISDDGQCVAFETEAFNLVAEDTDTTKDICVRDIEDGTTTLVSIAGSTKADGFCHRPFISADGSVVVFRSNAVSLGSVNAEYDIFRKDLISGDLTMVATKDTGAELALSAGVASISGDGRFVAFDTEDPDVVAGDLNGTGDVFVYDHLTCSTAMVSNHVCGTDAQRSTSHTAQVSADGRFVAFSSAAPNLVDPPDTLNYVDVFVGPNPVVW